MRFTTTVFSGGGNTTGIVIPPEVVDALGAGRRPPVTVTINGSTFRNTVAVMGGEYLVGISAANRALTGVGAGDEVEVTIELDTAPRTVTVPDDLAAALSAVPGARAAFDALSYSKQRQHVLPVEDAKTAETRARRVAKVVAAVTGASG